jgi:ATP-dependent RNA helicase DeaD
MKNFEDFGLDDRIGKSITALGFEKTTPIQAEAIPPLMEGRDIIGQARTGSGKTAAFGLPLLHSVIDAKRGVKALVMAPTRELALQVTDALESYSKHLNVRMVTIYGGAPYPPQLKALRSGVSIVVGTPGRILDHLERGSMDLSGLEMLVLDEADEMLRMGFIESIEKIMEATPDNRQIALFSATMPNAIKRVAERFLNNPVHVQVESGAMTTDHIHQRWMKVPNKHKKNALIRLLKAEDRGGTLIFCRTRRGCGETAEALIAQGVNADAIHGELSQAARERVLKRFRGKTLGTLVATDVAARGLDVSHITHVINFDFPGDPESYVHRIGRTGRAGAEGKAITFVTGAEQSKLRFLIKKAKTKIEQMNVPSDAEVAGAERGILVKELKKAIAKKNIDEAREWLNKVLEEEELTLEDVAVAATMILAERQGISIGPAAKGQERPHWAKNEDERGQRQDMPRDNRGRLDFSSVNEVEVFLSIGRVAGVGPGDIVGAIANEVGIPGGQIGKVSLFDHKTFVGLSKVNADQLLAAHDTLEIRGKHVNLKLASPRDSGGGGGGGRPKQSWNKTFNDDGGAKRPWKPKRSEGGKKGPGAYKGAKKGSTKR